MSWKITFLQQIVKADISVKATEMSPHIELCQIDATHWQQIAQIAKENQLRWAAGWAEQTGEQFQVHACFERDGAYLLFRTNVNEVKPQLPSQANVYAAANRSERHTHDLFGIEFLQHPDPRGWTRHKAWGRHDYPLRHNFPVNGQPAEITPPDTDYHFVEAHGVGVYEIPVGPVHAGIIEPGHFRFQAVGELILNLEERLGYVHKGIEKIAEGRTPEGLAKLAGRVSGDTSVAHTWAACTAMEQAAGVEIPRRAALIRGIFAERERIANHMGDIGAIGNDVAFTFAFMQMMRLKELLCRTNYELFGHRFLMDKIVAGGVNIDINDAAGKFMLIEINELRVELAQIIPAIDLSSSLEDRIYTAGYLSPQTAELFGTLGFVGRASGQDFDVRRDAPYAPYENVKVKVPLETQGDIASRFWVRYKEINVSLKLMEQFIAQLDLLPEGDLIAPWTIPNNGSFGLGIVEGWRGEIITYVAFGRNNVISRFYPRDPSQFNWEPLEKAVLNNIVPDFPVCNKSFNCSYSGSDL